MSERGPSSPTGSLQPSDTREASSVPASAPGGAVPAIADEEPRRQLGHRPCTAASMAAVAPTPTRPAAQPPRMDRNASDRQWMWRRIRAEGKSEQRGNRASPASPAQNRGGEPMSQQIAAAAEPSPRAHVLPMRQRPSRVLGKVSRRASTDRCRDDEQRREHDPAGSESHAGHPDPQREPATLFPRNE